MSDFDATACTGPLLDTVARYVRNSLSENTRRAYRSDLEHFAKWGGSIPTNDRAIAAYVAAQAGVSSWKIRQQTGHRSDAMLNRFVRIAELFVDNGASALL